MTSERVEMRIVGLSIQPRNCDMDRGIAATDSIVSPRSVALRDHSALWISKGSQGSLSARTDFLSPNIRNLIASEIFMNSYYLILSRYGITNSINYLSSTGIAELKRLHVINWRILSLYVGSVTPSSFDATMSMAVSYSTTTKRAHANRRGSIAIASLPDNQFFTSYGNPQFS